MKWNTSNLKSNQNEFNSNTRDTQLTPNAIFWRYGGDLDEIMTFARQFYVSVGLRLAAYLYVTFLSVETKPSTLFYLC